MAAQSTAHSNGSRRPRPAGRTAARAATAVAVAAGLLLAGCSTGGGGSNDTAKASGGDRAGGKRAAPGFADDGSGSGKARRDAAESKGQGEQPGDGGGSDKSFAAKPPMLSTFALDVDTASYEYSKRQLRDGTLPSPYQVRPEEFVNSFNQGYRQPKGNGFAVSTDGARTDVGGVRAPSREAVLRIGLSTRGEETRRRDAALTLSVDVSGSMSEEGRLDLVRYSIRHMVKKLRPTDSLAIIAFDDKAETVLPMTRVKHRKKILAAVDELKPGGSTDVSAGLRAAYREAERGLREGKTNRVVMMSDALANTGETDADAMLKTVEKSRKRSGITLFGVGVGSDYGDALMERLTNRGDGHTRYVASQAQGRKVFGRELPANLEVRARDAKAQVAFNRAAVEEFTLIGYENRKVADKDFRNDSVDGGEVGPGHTVTALYAVRLAPDASGRLAKATVRWQDPQSRRARERSHSIDVQQLAPALWGADAKVSPRLQVSAVAADFAQALRVAGGRPEGEQSRADVESGTVPAPKWSRVGANAGELLHFLSGKAQRLAGSTMDPEVKELADAIQMAERLAGR